MTYREAKKIKVGDIVITRPSGTRRKVIAVEISEGDKAVFTKCDNGIVYYHDAIIEIEALGKKREKYYQVLAFNPANEPDEVCNSHIYPSYVSCMSVKGGLSRPFPFASIETEPLMLQSNPHDGLKFIDLHNAMNVIGLAKKVWPKKEFEIIEMNALFYGRIQPRWVVDL